MQLAREEPEAGPWRVDLLSDVVDSLTRHRPYNPPPAGPWSWWPGRCYTVSVTR